MPQSPSTVRRALLPLTLALALAACAEDVTTGSAGGDATLDTGGVTTDLGGVAGNVDTGIAPPQDSGSTFTDADATTGPSPTTCEDPDSGELFCPCSTNADCLSGYCYVGKSVSVCTEQCVESCPDGWICKSVPNGPDIIYICAPRTDFLCTPCEADNACGKDGDLCVNVGTSGRHCGNACETDADCPADYHCEVEEGTEGTVGHQCLPNTYSCACPPALIGKSEGCSKTNDVGTCLGERTCKAEGGWSECSALEPAVETCNGVDDDCNGIADEGMDARACVNTTDAGSCEGTETCQGQKGWVCDAATPGPDLCNGKDDDCDGATDEDFPLLGEACDGNDADSCPAGAWACANDGSQLICEGDVATNEQCNGKDDDCDGETDEDWPELGTFCDTPDPDQCPTGTFTCAGPAGVACFGDVNSVEQCNGVDDDCDGETDEGSQDTDQDGEADCTDLDDDGDGDPDATDCKPLDPAFHHGAEEVCDGLDNDCDGLADEDSSDIDGDGIADCKDDDMDGDGVKNYNDNCPTVPNLGQKDTDSDGAGDACDDDDDDDGVPDVDDLCPLVADPDQVDTDQDGAGDACDDDDDGDGDDDITDCKPLDPAIHHGATEVCNGVDDNCTVIVDEGFPDFDADYVADCVDTDDDNDEDPDVTDCQPKNPAVFTGAFELCNGTDDNCDGQIDEGWPDEDGNGTPDCVDEDIDGDGDPNATDCEPADPAIHHNAVEICDGLDNDCDKVVDEGFPDIDGDGLKGCLDDDDDGDGILDVDDNCPLVPNVSQSDTDGDGLGNACDTDDDGDGDPDELDCAPLDPTIHHGAAEVCNGKDDDCSGVPDEEGAVGCEIYYLDTDGDGYGNGAQSKCLCNPVGKISSVDPTDCNDTNGSVFPGAPELCNGADDDCDEQIDEAGAVGCLTWFTDADGDGMGAAGTGQCLCGPSGLQSAKLDGDCDDGDPKVLPGGVELCNGKDDDCDGQLDEEGASGCTVWYMDKDGDGFGTGVVVKCLCGPAAPWAAPFAGDCNDDVKEIGPGQPESCNGTDDDCDGQVDEAGAFGCTEYMRDLDGDGYGKADDVLCLCAPAGAYGETIGVDCADAAQFVYPGAPEICNLIDDDCDEDIDEDGALGCKVVYPDEDGDGFGVSGPDAPCVCGSGTTSAAIAGDCDDADDTVNPAANELCNQKDDDCNGKVDEWYPDTDGDGVADCVDTDDDDDGILDDVDNCPTVYNPDQKDTDGNGLGDACGQDADGDGDPDVTDCNDEDPAINHDADELCDGIDNDCNKLVDEGYTDTDKDKQADCVDVDDDGDGILDEADNCPLDANADQANMDGDSLGDACDGDIDGDGDPNTFDCAPLDKDVFHGAVEVCNGKDDDCVAGVDQEGADGCVEWHRDFDGDGYGHPTETACLCAKAAPYTATTGDDCNDGLASIHPGAPEACNQFDDDCDGEVDEVGATGCYAWLKDADQDGYGITGTSQCSCQPSEPWTATIGGDCDDTDGKVSPSAAEICNGKDDDCDGQIDEGQTDTDKDGLADCVDPDDDDDGILDGADNCPLTKNPGQQDTDNDGKGDACDGDADGDGDPDTFDCAPTDPAVFHGATEACNGKDDDCDGAVDEEGAAGCLTLWADEDGDSFGAKGASKCLCAKDAPWTATVGGDCNDSDAAVKPSAAEACNQKDDDCDGLVDEEGATGCKPWYTDADNDGYGSGASKCQCGAFGEFDAKEPGDCNEADASVHPGAFEQCNGIDDNCDGKKDEGFEDTDADGQADCVDPDDDDDGILDGDDNCPLFPNPDQADSDGDGIGDACEADLDGDGDADNTDCAPTDPSRFHGALEVCNGVDDDCDGVADEADAEGCFTHYRDLDGDGYGADFDAKCLCGPSGSHTATVPGDCNDNVATIKPGAQEVCNQADDDCDGAVDEGAATGCTAWAMDADGDGYGVTGSTQCTCAPQGVYTATKVGDCNDGNVGVHPGASEACNGVDDDCDGSVDEGAATGCTTYYLDGDKDGYGQGSGSACLCAPQGKQTALVAGDCNDADAAVSPGAAESCNGKDDDCDGAVDEQNALGCEVWYFDGDADGYGVSNNGKCLCGQSGQWSTKLAGDCDDASPLVKPGATESCNGKDDDCDGIVDELGAVGCVDYWEDKDKDGWGAGAPLCQCGPSGSRTATTAGDCNDLAASAYPGATEQCNGIDDDCNGAVPAKEADKDSDGQRGCEGDCNDNVATTYSGALELCNGVDDNCDGVLPADEVDNDGDGYSECAGDCNDASKVVAPGAPELCNGQDDNCDGALPANEADQDGDGVRGCNGDCNDKVATIKPGAPEVCNGLDDNCNGKTDEGFPDTDGDGIADCVEIDDDGDGDPDTTDCKPKDPTIHHGAKEICGDGIDNDCNAATWCTSVNGVEILPYLGTKSAKSLYKYGSPNGASANTGKEVSGKTVVFFYQEPGGAIALMIIHDKASDGSGGKVSMVMSGGNGMSIIQYDDPGEGGNHTLNATTGNGAFDWNWASCCTDGMAVGYLANNQCVTLTVTSYTGITGYRVLSSGTSYYQPASYTAPLKLCRGQ